MTTVFFLAYVLYCTWALRDISIGKNFAGSGLDSGVHTYLNYSVKKESQDGFAGSRHRKIRKMVR